MKELQEAIQALVDAPGWSDEDAAMLASILRVAQAAQKEDLLQPLVTLVAQWMETNV